MTMVFFRASGTITDGMHVAPLILDDDRRPEANGLVFMRVDLSHLTDKDDIPFLCRAPFCATRVTHRGGSDDGGKYWCR